VLHRIGQLSRCCCLSTSPHSRLRPASATARCTNSVSIYRRRHLDVTACCSCKQPPIRVPSAFSRWTAARHELKCPLTNAAISNCVCPAYCILFQSRARIPSPRMATKKAVEPEGVSKKLVVVGTPCPPLSPRFLAPMLCLRQLWCRQNCSRAAIRAKHI
jgi:hypothetical protein